MKSPVTSLDTTAKTWTVASIDTDERCIHDARGRYVEEFWTPILGPSQTGFLRYFSTPLRETRSVEMPLEVLPMLVGLRQSFALGGPFLRMLKRLVDFEMAEVLGPTTYGVRTYLPPVPPWKVSKFHPFLIERHKAFEAREAV